MDVVKFGEKVKHLLLEKSRGALAKDSSVFICCPFHGEKEPSCSVNIFNPQFLPGTWHCFGCLAPDSLVFTQGGLKPIQDISLHELVYDVHGSLEPVIAVAQHPPIGHHTLLQISVGTKTLNVTLNHDMLVYKEHDFVKIFAHQLCVGDYIPFPSQAQISAYPNHPIFTQLRQHYQQGYPQIVRHGLNYTLLQVTRLAHVPLPELVYDLTVATSHTFLTEIGAVGNCGESGNWNDLAQQLKIDFKVNIPELQACLKHSVRDLDLNLEEEQPKTVEQFLRKQHFDGYTEWPTQQAWRGVDYKFLQLIEAWLIYEFNEQRCFLPVKVNGRVVGGIRARIENKKYLTTTGNWVKTHGLLPFDVTKKLMRNAKWRRKFVVLVEGPRDVARLLLAGIPALAILGAEQWSQEKTDLLLSISCDDFDVITIFDSDRGGRAATKLVKSYLKGLVKVRKVNLPDATTEDGKLTKCDVFNLSQIKFNRLKQSLFKLYGRKPE